MMSFRWLQDEGMELCNNSGMKTAAVPHKPFGW